MTEPYYRITKDKNGAFVAQVRKWYGWKKIGYATSYLERAISHIIDDVKSREDKLLAGSVLNVFDRFGKEIGNNQ